MTSTATGAAGCGILSADSPKCISRADANSDDAVSLGEFAVPVIFCLKEATLAFDRTHQRLFLSRRDARGREVKVLDIPVESIVNVESAEERLVRRVRSARLKESYPEAFAKEVRAAATASRSLTLDEGGSPRSAGKQSLAPHTNARSTGAPRILCDSGEEVTTVFFLHFCYSSTNASVAPLRTVEFSSPPGAEEHMRVCKAVHSLLGAVYRGGLRKLIFFVSPKSGSGRALQTCIKKIFPVLQFARHEIEVIETQRAHHCEDYLADPANGVDDRCVVVLVGGDGIVHEAVNGIHRRRIAAISAREQKEKEAEGRAKQKAFEEVPESFLRGARGDNAVQLQIDHSRHLSEPVSLVPAGTLGSSIPSKSDVRADSVPLLATIATGSGCAMATSLGVLSFRKAALALVHLETCVKDLMSLQYDMGSVFHSPKNARRGAFPHCKLPSLHRMDSQLAERVAFMSVSFGNLNEIDRGSEKLRWMGNARFATYCLYKLIRGFQTHRAKLRYLPWRGVSGRQLRKFRSGDAMPSESEFPPCTMDSTCAHCRAHGAEEGDAHDNASFEPLRQSIDFDDLSLPWVTVDGDHYSIFIGNLRDMSRDAMFAPLAHLSDGAIDLVYTKSDAKPQGRRDFLKFFTRLEKGKHVDLPFVCYVKAVAIELTAIDNLLMSDGEVMPFKSIRVTPMRCAARFVRSSFK